MAKLRYRPDVDGLRAVAVAGVMLFHLGVPHIGGGFFGVDVFFVISGYLITSLLFVEFAASGRIDFANFWARRTRRILPSALLVIAVTLIAASFVVSDLTLFYAARDAIYAALYIINWQQLAESLDYFDDRVGNGLFLHYWSLAIEEQFYVFLALIFAIAIGSRRFLLKTRATTVKPILIGLLIASAVASFIAMLASEPPVAFFGTHARIWELSLGAGAGLLEQNGWTPGATTRSLMAWLGAAAIVGAFLGYDWLNVASPGAYTLLPTLGALLLVLAGIKGSSRLPLPLWLEATLLPVVIGRLSYALYLWHWPVFELYKAYFGVWTVSDRIIAVAATVVLSIASHLAVENPIRFGTRLNPWPRQTLAAAAALSLLLVAGAAALHRDIGNKYIVLASGHAFDPRKVRKDRMGRAVGCHSLMRDTNYKACVFGRKTSSRRIFLIGDSHAVQWFTAVDAVAKKRHMALHLRTKDACLVMETPLLSAKLGRVLNECGQWRGQAAG